MVLINQKLLSHKLVGIETGFTPNQDCIRRDGRPSASN